MDPYIIPNNSLHNPFPHSLLRTRQSFIVFAFRLGLGVAAVQGSPFPVIKFHDGFTSHVLQKELAW